MILAYQYYTVRTKTFWPLNSNHVQAEHNGAAPNCRSRGPSPSKDTLNGVHNLSNEQRNALFFVSAHSGVIYDYGTRTQQLLQGHCNPITASNVSADKRWVATADAGPDSMIVVWDTLSTTPIKTLFNPHPFGVQAMAMTPDAMFLATLSAPDPEDPNRSQQIALWEWTRPV